MGSVMATRIKAVNNWTVSENYTLPNGKMLSSGDIIRIDGEQGKRFIFSNHVYNHDNDKEWIDCYEIWKGAPSMIRSFRPHRIRTMTGKKARAAAPRPKATGNAEAIRAWAKENNVPVSERGRISKAVRDQYEAANRV